MGPRTRDRCPGFRPPRSLRPLSESRVRQAIRYLRTDDRVCLAWAEAGRGPTLVKAANWMTHLELEGKSPVWRHWIEFFSSHFRFVRYDERGCGMSDWDIGDLGQERWADDLEAVVEAAGCSEPIVLLGISQGGAPAIELAARHPERVSHLVLYGCYSQGWMSRVDEGSRRRYEAMIELIEHGWGRSNPVFRQLFTSRFIPGGTDEQLNWFNELCLKTTSAKNAARLLEARAHVDVRQRLGDIRVPTLVLHARDDDVIPLSSGKILASEIPGAEFVELDSATHILLQDEPAWRRFREAVLDFTGVAVPAERATAEPAFAALSPREREVLGLISEGLSNAEIAARLRISDKTVRNHVSNLFGKLGVWTRAQAIVFARDRGFRSSA
jgi:pimeloyl-ACP methyl ester carboxylesterase/DNA-binding CsgD family transcriptional regulator